MIRPFRLIGEAGISRVYLGETDISRHITSVRLEHHAKDVHADVELTLAPTAFVYDGEAIVDVNAWATGILIDLGWAPPAVDE